MAVGDEVPPWVDFVLDRMDKSFDGVNSRLDRLVTQEAFRQEQSRVNERMRGFEDRVGKNETAVQAEATARATENKIKLEQENAQKERIIATQKQTQWQWLLIVAGPIVGWILASVLPPIGGP
jgi:hypothetical protein